MDQSGTRTPAEFLSSLKGARIALAYSHRFRGSLEETWYHLWRTDVIAYFSQAVEILGATPVFFNIDQFIAHFGDPRQDAAIDFVVNLNAGNRFLDNLAIVPALACWRRIPVFPGTAFSALVGEQKETSKTIAGAMGWRTAPRLGDITDPEALVVVKPLTFGSSVGLERRTFAEIQASGVPRRSMAEGFIPGHDATIVVLHSLIEQRSVCLGAMVHLPQRPSPEDWMYDAFEKRNPNVRTRVETRFYDVHSSLAAASVALAEAFDAHAVARIDVRLSDVPKDGDVLSLEACTFLEINTMPTIGPDYSVSMLAQRYLAERSNLSPFDAILNVARTGDEKAGAFILASGLWAVTA